MRGRTTWASGSPSRQLNSTTFGPSSVSIRPAYRNPRYGEPRSASAARAGTAIRDRTSSTSSGVPSATGA